MNRLKRNLEKSLTIIGGHNFLNFHGNMLARRRCIDNGYIMICMHDLDGAQASNSLIISLMDADEVANPKGGPSSFVLHNKLLLCVMRLACVMCVHVGIVRELQL